MAVLKNFAHLGLLVLASWLLASCNPLATQQGSTVNDDYFAGLELGKYPDHLEVLSDLSLPAYTNSQYPTIVVRVLDHKNIPVRGAEFILVTTSGTAVASPLITDNEGKAEIDWTFGHTAGQAELVVKARVSDYSASKKIIMDLQTSLVSIANSTITGTSSVVANGTASSTVTISLNDVNNYPVEGVTPSFSATDTDSKNVYGACTTSDLSGISTCTLKSTRAEIKTLSLLSPVTLTGSTVTFVPGPVAHLSLSQGNNQTGHVGSALGTQLQVLLRDAFSNPVSGTSVSWSASKGSLSASTVLSDSDGIATNTFTLGTGGAHTVVASIPSTSLSVTFNSMATVDVPASLAASLDDASADLSWTSVTDAVSYVVYRSASSSGPFVSVGTTLTNSFAASGLTNGTTYYFSVAAVNDAFESSRSTAVSVRPAAPPGIPTGVGATYESEKTVLTWTAPASGTGPLKYHVYRSTTPGTGHTKVASDLSALTHTDTGLVNGTTYYYKITAENTNAEGDPSVEIALTPGVRAKLAYDFSSGSSFFSHNLLKGSSDLTDWVFSESEALRNVVMAPDKTFTGYKLVASTTAATHYGAAASVTIRAGLSYTGSVFLKKSEESIVSIDLRNSAYWGGVNPRVYVNLSTGVITSKATNVTAASITHVGDDWYRVSLTAVATSAGFTSLKLNHNYSTAGTGKSGFYFWGAQLEQNPGVSSYVATTSAPGANFVSALSPTLGSTVLNFSRNDSSPTATVWGSDGLLRRAPHNLLARSQNFSSTWANSNNNISFATGVLAPDGTTTATKITRTLTASPAYLQNWGSAPVGENVTFSIFAKAAATGNRLGMRIQGSYPHRVDATFDLASGTLTGTYTNSFELVSTSINPVGNGWYRLALTAKAVGTAAAVVILSPTDSSRGTAGFEGASTVLSDAYVWGAQLERNINPSSYVATTTAAMYNSPRFDFDPLTLKPLGLLIEGSATNLVTNSNDFSNSNWTKQEVSVSTDVAQAPDGQLAADKLVESAVNDSHMVVNAATSLTAGTVYTGSLFLKAAGRTSTAVQLSNSSAWSGGVNPAVVVNLSTCSVTSQANVLTASAKSVGSEWCRVSVTQAPASSASSGLNVLLMNGSSYTYTGDGTSGVYAWGAQIESNPSATSYVPTVASATRLAENVSAGSMSWFDQSKGTFLSEFTENSTSTGTRLIYGADTPSNALFVGGRDGAGNLIYFNTKVSNSDVASIRNPDPLAALPSRLASAYSSGDYASAYKGTLVQDSTAGALPSLTTLSVGSNGTNTFLNGWIGQIHYFTSRLSDAELIRLTQ